MNFVQEHYAADNLLERIFGALVMAGKDPWSLKVDDLAPVDEFHTRGRTSTLELCEFAEIKQPYRVLDIGCGLGGSARFLANEYGCRVTGIDLTNDYIKVAKRLTSLVGLDDRVDFFKEDATQLSFDSGAFDLVWTEHVQMNIENKRAFYQEVARVLKPGGRFVFHDVFSTEPKQGVRYPLPWADRPEISFLCSTDLAKDHMRRAGIKLKELVIKTEESILAFEEVAEKLASGDPPPLGLHLLMGTQTKTKIANYLTYLKKHAICVGMGYAIRKPLNKSQPTGNSTT